MYIEMIMDVLNVVYARLTLPVYASLPLPSVSSQNRYKLCDKRLVVVPTSCTAPSNYLCISIVLSSPCAKVCNARSCKTAQ